MKGAVHLQRGAPAFLPVPSALPVRHVESRSGAEVVVDGRLMLNFSGSGYLGLGLEDSIVEAGALALRKFGASSQLGRHYGFGLTANRDAESEACRFFDTEAAMYFGTGYMFGLIALAGLAAHCDAVFLDESAHYSLRDGASATGKPVHFFAHRDSADLARVIEKEIGHTGRPLVASDGMFPTYGSIAPLADYARLVERRDGWLVVDESHAFGVLGANGRGAVEAAGVARDRVVAGGSMAKAFAAHGGVAIGSAAVVAALWQTPAARGAVLGSSAGAAMSAASLRHAGRHPELRARLRANTRSLKTRLRGLGLDIEENDAPLATFAYRGAEEMQDIQARLMALGIVVSYSRYVGAGPSGVIRIATFADHREEHLERLQMALGTLM